MGRNDVEIKVVLKGRAGAQYIKAMAAIKNENRKVGRSMKNVETASAKSFNNMKQSALGYKLALTAIVGFITGKLARAFIKAGSEVEDYTKQFKVLLGTTEAAKNRMAELEKFAQVTPFKLTDLANATQQMLSFGIESDKVMTYLKQLGDVSLGNREKFERLALAFSQTQSAGKLMGQDLLQYINAGFNPLLIISQQTGESMLQLRKRMEQGNISAKEVAETFKIATSEGGRFNKGMLEMSTSVTGLSSTFSDQLSRAMRQMMESGVWDAIQSGMTQLVGLMNKAISDGVFQKWGKALGEITEKVKWLMGFSQTGIMGWEKDAKHLKTVVDAMKELQYQQEALERAKVKVEVSKGFMGTTNEKHRQALEELIVAEERVAAQYAILDKTAGKMFVHENSNLQRMIEVYGEKYKKLKDIKTITEETGKAPPPPTIKKINDDYEKSASMRESPLDESRRKSADLQAKLVDQYLDGIARENAALAYQIQEEIRLRKEQIEIQERQKQGALTAASSVLGAMRTVFPEMKAFAVMQATVDAYAAGNAAYKAMAGIPVIGPGLGIAAGFAATIQGLSNVQKIVSAADGGVFTGPRSGYPATLHGTEAIIPLKNGAVPVMIEGGGMGSQTIINNYYNIPGGNPQAITEPERLLQLSESNQQMAALNV